MHGKVYRRKYLTTIASITQCNGNKIYFRGAAKQNFLDEQNTTYFRRNNLLRVEEKSCNIKYCNKKKIYNNKGNYNIQFAEPFANRNFGILTIEYLRGSTQSSENGYIHFQQAIKYDNLFAKVLTNFQLLYIIKPTLALLILLTKKYFLIRNVL